MNYRLWHGAAIYLGAVTGDFTAAGASARTTKSQDIDT